MVQEDIEKFTKIGNKRKNDKPQLVHQTHYIISKAHHGYVHHKNKTHR